MRLNPSFKHDEIKSVCKPVKGNIQVLEFGFFSEFKKCYILIPLWNKLYNIKIGG
jgi:hypothetical protein